MAFPKPWVKHSLEFSRFSSFLHQFIDPKKKTGCNLIWLSLLDKISRTKTDTKWTKRPINKYRVEEPKTLKIADSSKSFCLISNTFISNTRLKSTKKSSKCSTTTLRLNFCYLKTIHSSYMLSSKNINNRPYSKNKQNNSCVCFHEIIRLIIMKMEMKIKNRPHR